MTLCARRCGFTLDPALVAAGFKTHPCCDPDEPWCRSPHEGPHQPATLPSGALICTITEPEAG